MVSLRSMRLYMPELRYGILWTHSIMSIIGTIYEDVTTDVLGDIGSWQWLVTIVSTILMTSSFFHHYEDIFLLHPSKIVCSPSEGYDDIFNETLCTFTIANGSQINCEKWHVKLLWIIWVKKSWLIFCDDNMKLLLTAVICRSATVFGFIIFGLVADSFGRKIAITLNVFGALGLRLVTTFCDSEGWFRLVLFLSSLFGAANLYMSLVIVCEIASNGWRSWLSVIVMSPRLVALVCMVHVANGATNTETYNLIGCVFGVIYIVTLRWVPESPQWMLYNRKIHVAEKLLARAAMTNNINFSAEFKIRPVNKRAYVTLDETRTCFGILTVHNIRVIVIISVVFWGLFYFIWGTLYMKIYSDGIGNSILLKVFCFLGVLGFLTAVLSSILTLQRFLIINITMTGLITAGVVIFEQPVVREILSSMALASGLMVHGLLLNMTPRFYSINIRATIFGCCHATGHIGSMISYIIFIFKAMDDNTFVALEIGISVILVVLSFMMPKVDGRELPDVMEDMDYFSELSKPLRWATQKRSSPSKEEVEMRIYSFGSVMPSSSTARYWAPDRTPAQPLGFKKVWCRLADCVRRRKLRSVVPVENEGQASSTDNDPK